MVYATIRQHGDVVTNNGQLNGQLNDNEYIYAI